ncbi:MAG: DUF4340 domain-containing protein [Candidatus Hydrogenedentota bacterium]|nr:MAG: DUF4340 domain-containing protein [Candidatus Hydrogenedentota bacterium]
MSYKRTLVFLIIFVALAAFFYLYEFKGGEARREAERKAKLLFSFKPESVTELVLRKPEEVIVTERENGKWTIKEPVNAAAEQRTVEQILNTLSDLKYERDIGPQADLLPFGLSEPEVEVEIKGTQGIIDRLLLGASTPDGANSYAKRSSGEQVFTVSKSARSTMDRSLFDMRDKTVFDFSVPEVQGLTAYRNGRTLKFEKRQEGEWMMSSPEERIADAGKIRGLLDTIKYARIKKFIEEEASDPDLQKYGLASPSARLELALGDTMKVLAFGNQTGSDSQSVYVRRGNQRQILELGVDILNSLSADVDDWRDTHVAKFARNDVARLQIDSPAGAIAVERSEENFEDWRLVKPEPGVADEDRVGTLLSDVRNARVTRFPKADELTAAEASFENPLIRLSLWNKNNETLLTLLLSDSGNKDELYAGMEETGEILVVDEQLLEKLTIGPDEIRDKSVLRFNATDIERIEVATGGESFLIKRKGVNWKVPGSLEMESYEIDQFLWDLRGMKYKARGQKREDDAHYGFDSPALIVRLWSSGEDRPVGLVVGKRVAEHDSYYVVHSHNDQLMEVEGEPLSEWLDRF